MTYKLDQYSDSQSLPTYQVRDFQVAQGCVSSVALDGQDVSINLSGFSHLKTGENESIVISYKIVDAFGLELPKLAVLQVEGTQAKPKLHCAPLKISKSNEQVISVQIA